MNISSNQILYRDENIIFGEADDQYYLISDQRSYCISDSIYEPCLFIETDDGFNMVVHDAFTVDKLCSLIKTNGALTMPSGRTFDVPGLFTLIIKTIDLHRDSVDCGYVEGQIYIDYMKAHDATSPETAVDLCEAGMVRPQVMSPFIHSKQVGYTSDGRHYLLRPKE